VSFEEGTENRVSTVFLSLSDGRRRVLADHERSASVPASWSPDGRYLVFGDRGSCVQGVNRPYLGILDLRTARVIPASEGELSCPTVATDAGSPAVQFLAWLAS
jgi:Tol biopolymer transport system component